MCCIKMSIDKIPQHPIPIVEWRVRRLVMELMEGNDTILVAPLKSLEDGDIKASTKREKEKEK